MSTYETITVEKADGGLVLGARPLADDCAIASIDNKDLCGLRAAIDA